MDQHAETIQKALTGSLNIIEQDREKEIISRRFGLNGQKETLEQIGEVLSITRERVRQLEKAIIIRLRVMAEDNQIPELGAAEKIIMKKTPPPLISLVKFLPAWSTSTNLSAITMPPGLLNMATNAKSSAKLMKLSPLFATISFQ